MVSWEVLKLNYHTATINGMQGDCSIANIEFKPPTCRKKKCNENHTRINIFKTGNEMESDLCIHFQDHICKVLVVDPQRGNAMSDNAQVSNSHPLPRNYIYIGTQSRDSICIGQTELRIHIPWIVEVFFSERRQSKNRGRCVSLLFIFSNICSTLTRGGACLAWASSPKTAHGSSMYWILNKALDGENEFNRKVPRYEQYRTHNSILLATSS